MKIGVQEAARLLSVSEKSIYRWIKAGLLPGYRINDQYRFDRSELLAWAVSRRINVPQEAFHDSIRVVGPIPTLAQAIKSGGIHYRIQATSKEEALRALAECGRGEGQTQSQNIFSVLMAREALAPTGVGEGVAIPQLVYPNALDLNLPRITLMFLEDPVDYDSLDGKPVQVLLGVLCSSLRAYHILLNRLYYALRDRQLVHCLQEQGGRNQILEHLGRIESGLRQSDPSEEN
ncbi:PTS sugar transporter subunit IIA [bacterium]|nr:PTS sugar transporter subunit IIA [bacterium]